MKRNPISCMGFLGFLGLVGLITGNVGFYGFFGFFGFFGLARQRDDEMLRHNMARPGGIKCLCRFAYRFFRSDCWIIYS
jgi:hypothetical protein